MHHSETRDDAHRRVIYDLPFLEERAKRNILGANAARLFGPRYQAGEKETVRHHGGSRLSVAKNSHSRLVGTASTGVAVRHNPVTPP
jgi:hypothetical protein